MISHEELDDAVAAGAIPAEAAQALRRHVAALRQAPAADEEHFRLLTGFNDLFVVIAGLLVLLSLRWLVERTANAPLGSLAMSLLGWGLAEFFVRRRRLALPAIVLTAACLAGVFMAAYGALPETPSRALAAAACASVPAWLHWRRFQVPITPALAASAWATGLALALPTAALMPVLALFGLATLALAMYWDISDRMRQTRRADVAFWLHLVAAPLLVHSCFSSLEVFKDHPEAGVALVVCLAYLVLGWVSLVLDRRALMVSALGYVLFAMTVMLEKQGRVDTAFASAALLVGAALLLLSARWDRVRALAVAPLPPALKRRLAPLRGEPA